MHDSDKVIMVVMLAGAFWWLAAAWWKGVLLRPREPEDKPNRLTLLDGREVEPWM